MDTSVILALGSNLGDRSQYIKHALDEIKTISKSILNYSHIYETSPLGPKPQNNYLNQCISFETNLTPLELLNFCKQTEIKLGRQSRSHWNSREIDLDILVYGQESISLPNLQIPHCEILNRIFVLKPLTDIATNLILPNQKKSISELLNTLFPNHKDLPLIVCNS